jgi:MFS transporter, DHA2 family, methylenomycin A resistance protein
MTGSPATLLRRTVSPARHAGSPRTVLFVMCAGYFLVLLDVTIVNVALPSIGAGLGTDIGGLQWVVDGYALALAALMLTSGTAGDLYGHRRVVLTGLVVFGVGSLACGLAPGVSVLVAARVVQGLGAALLLPGTLAIISRAFPDRAARARAIGVWAGIGSLALPAGPLLGGVLTDTFGWRAIFLLNVPIVLVAVVWSAAIVRESGQERARRLDVPGLLLGSALLLATTYAFIEGGRVGATAPQVLAAAALVLLAVPALAVAEIRRGDDAMLPVSLLRRPVFDAANVAAGIMNLGTLGTLFVLMLFLQSVQDRSPLLAGAAVIPLFAPLAVLAPFGGRITSRIGARLPATARAAGGRRRARAPGPGRAALLVPGTAARVPAVGRRHGPPHPGGRRRGRRRRPRRACRAGLRDEQHRTSDRGCDRYRGGGRGRRAACRRDPFRTGIPCRRTRSRGPLHGRRAARADPAAWRPDTGPGKVTAAGAPRQDPGRSMLRAARALWVCAVTDLLPAQVLCQGA